MNRSLLRSPLFLVLVATLVLHAVALTWGLPASDGWDDDGIAPRDFLVGVVETYTPGSYFTYPPVHLLLLTILNAPAALVALAHAPSHAPADVVATFIQVPYMTAFAIVARAVTVLMSLGIVWALAKIGEALGGARAGVWVAAAAGVNATFTYYAHTSNLDVPYLFWASLALLAVTRALVLGEPRRLRHAAVLAALAIGTKDQAYAVFLVSLPVAIGAWLISPKGTPPPAAPQSWGGEDVRRVIAREAAIAALIAVVVLLVVDGAVVNPSGFRARLHFLAGTASQDHAYYPKTLGGTLLVVHDTLKRFVDFYPVSFAPFAIGGLVVAWQRARPGTARIAAVLPLLAMVSFLVAFNCTARRTEQRFVMPEWLFVAVYVGLAFDAVTAWIAARAGWLVAGAVAAFELAWALYGCVAVDVNLLFDPRYDAERWLAANVRPGDVVEVYGNNVYLPRFPPQAQVVRVDPSTVAGRSPLPGVREVQGAYADAPARAPRFIVVSEGWVWRYVGTYDAMLHEGHVLSHVQEAALEDVPSRTFFQALHANGAGYHWAHLSAFQSALFPRVDIHASTSREIRIFERD